MDFMERLKDRVNEIPNLPIPCKLGFPDVKESFKLYSMPGGQVVTSYYDGIKDQRLNFEFVCRSDDPKKINTLLWLVQSELEELSELTSLDGSFDFNDITIANKPYISTAEDQGWFEFAIDIQASLTTY